MGVMDGRSWPKTKRSNPPHGGRVRRRVDAARRRTGERGTVTRYALAYPDIRFRLTHDNRITFQSNGSGQLKDVLVSVYGPDTARDLLEIQSDMEEDEANAIQSPAKAIQVSGYAGPPRLNWANRTHITLFVNGRWIKDNRLTYAVIQAYHTLLPTGRYPLAVLFLIMPPELVDVNVHPAKTEVRFRQANAAFGAVQRAVRQTIVADTPIRDATHFASFQHTGWAGAAAGHDPDGWQMGGTNSQAGLDLDWSPGNELTGQITGTADPAANNEAMVGGGRIPIMRVIGQVGAAYIITEGPDGLYLIDQHAAHERILYEQFMAAWQENGSQEGIVSQGLVTGAAVQLAPAQADLLNEHLPLMSQLGFQVEPFGPNTFMVRSLPAIVAKIDPARALMDVIEDLERGDAPLQSKIEARIILRVCKSAAVKAGQTLSRQEMEAMIHQLENCQNPHSCPHGRPTLIHLSVAQLAREFGRV
jgi:DNA mismatch repair protein MutL